MKKPAATFDNDDLFAMPVKAAPSSQSSAAAVVGEMDEITKYIMQQSQSQSQSKGGLFE